MGVMANDEDFAQRYYGFAEMHPVGDDLVAGIELLPGLSIECEKDEIVHRSGAVLGRKRVVIDFILGAMQPCRALNRLLPSLDRIEQAKSTPEVAIPYRPQQQPGTP